MSFRKREGNRPDRRILDASETTTRVRLALCIRASYVGSANHKLHPGDYGFIPSHNPRPSKSACDDLRPVSLQEASELFREGIMRGMVSFIGTNGIPKYVWAVDSNGEVYEAKTKPDLETCYHGYRLSEDDKRMRDYVRKEWSRR